MRAKILIMGNIGSGKSTLARWLADRLAFLHVGIDECRCAHSDGTAAGEATAWSRFLSHAQDHRPVILDCTGIGPFGHLLRHALSSSGLPIGLVWLRAPAEVCLQRISGRTWSTPYPDFGAPIDQVIRLLDVRLNEEVHRWPEPVIALDGTVPPNVIQSEALARLQMALGPLYQPEGASPPISSQVSAMPGETARQMIAWAAATPPVQALFFCGSHARGEAPPGSDLDIAALIADSGSFRPVVCSLDAFFSERVRHQITSVREGRVCLWLDECWQKLDLHLSHDPRELAWLAAAPDVPPPRLLAAFVREGAPVADLLAMATTATARDPGRVSRQADEELDKFLLAFDDCARASRRGDDYAAYFHYNLALHRLARLIQLTRGGALYLYLPRDLLTMRLAPAEQREFRALAGALAREEMRDRRRALANFFRRLSVEFRNILDGWRSRDPLDFLQRAI